MPYSQACRLMASKGYILHIQSVQGTLHKLPSASCASTTFAVEIADSKYNFETNTPSKDAIITSLIEVKPKCSAF